MTSSPSVAHALRTAESTAPPPIPLGQAAGIDVVGLSKRFGPVTALHELDLAVPLGSSTALVGRNGAGKSTLIRVLATAVRPDSGRVSVCGRDAVADALGVRRQIGLALGEDRSFFWRLSGRKNLEFFGRLYGVPGNQLDGRVGDVLEAVELVDVADRRVDRYSTGMRSRLGIARALLGAPRVLLLDEPTRSLDPATAVSVQEIFRRLLSSGERCALLATHDLEEAVLLADQIVVMRAGEVVERMARPFDIPMIEATIRGRP